MKKLIPIIIVIAALAFIFWPKKSVTPDSVSLITTFTECVDAGNAVMESYPRQCTSGNKTFVEYIGNSLEKTDLIVVQNIVPNQKISNPVVITGKARGYWYFEASFPINLTDSNGNIIGQGIATAQDEWMTEDFVPFTATIAYTLDSNLSNKNGNLILHKDNPSGLAENDDSLTIPVSME